MKNKLSLLAILFTIYINGLQAQVTPEWVQHYSGSGTGHEDARKVATDNSGNVYVGGSSLEGLPGTEDFLLLKYNPSGILTWERRYASPENGADLITDIGIDNSGNIYVTGYSFLVTTWNQVTIKYNSDGDSLWVRKQAGTGNSNYVTPSGNVYVTAPTALYNTNGDLQWIDTTVGGQDITVDGLGNVYIIRAKYHPGDNGCDYSTVKFNPDGVIQWDSRYVVSDGFFAVPQSIDVSQSGNVYVTGRNGTEGAVDNWDITTLKYNSSGTQQWIKTYHGSGVQSAASGNVLKIDNSENVYVAGSTGIINGMVTLKYDSGGNVLWVDSSSAGANAYDLVLDASNNVFVTGRNVGGIWQCVTEKYNSNGQLIWSSAYFGGSCEGFSIALDATENIYVAGIEWFNGHRSCLTIKYSHPTGIIQNILSGPDNFSLSQNFPNPFNPATQIVFGIPNLEFVSLKVYDILGNEVATLVNEKLNAGSYEAEFDGSNFPSGVYFYKLQAGEFVETKRMSLLK